MEIKFKKDKATLVAKGEVQAAAIFKGGKSGFEPATKEDAAKLKELGLLK